MVNFEPLTNQYSETVLALNWAAFEHNLNYFRKKLEKKTKLMLMVKASAYGHHGVTFVHKIQQKKIADYLGVATLDEGIQLRNAGIEIPIMVQNPNPDHWHELIEHQLEPVLFNFERLHSFAKYLNSTTFNKDSYPIHIKLNTGMNRVGFNSNELEKLMEVLKSHPIFKVKSVMSHLSSAGRPIENDYTMNQLEEFEKCRLQLIPILSPTTFFHILNTSGIDRFIEYQYNMVRLGIGLYGASNSETLRKNLKPVAQLKTKVTTIRTVKAGESVSYNRSGKLKAQSNIAILSLGYADGFPRKLGNGKWQVEIKGRLYPTIGDICMDLSLINLGNDQVEIGDEVTIFGGKKTIFDFAEAQETITYEALTNLGLRVKRVLT